MDRFDFAPASPTEDIVYGASRPGYPASTPTESDIGEWIAFMKAAGIDRVCCLLDAELAMYDDLLGRYRAEFGEDRVCHAPIPDYSVVSKRQFHDQIFPFLKDAANESEKVVVHCAAGMGRTGHVLALWLVRGREYGVEEAVWTVRETGRDPLETASVSEIAEISSVK